MITDAAPSSHAVVKGDSLSTDARRIDLPYVQDMY